MHTNVAGHHDLFVLKTTSCTLWRGLYPAELTYSSTVKRKDLASQLSILVSGERKEVDYFDTDATTCQSLSRKQQIVTRTPRYTPWTSVSAEQRHWYRTETALSFLLPISKLSTQRKPQEHHSWWLFHFGSEADNPPRSPYLCSWPFPTHSCLLLRFLDSIGSRGDILWFLGHRRHRMGRLTMNGEL